MGCKWQLHCLVGMFFLNSLGSVVSCYIVYSSVVDHHNPLSLSVSPSLSLSLSLSLSVSFILLSPLPPLQGIIGEYSNPELEKLINWINTSLPQGIRTSIITSIMTSLSFSLLSHQMQYLLVVCL